MRPSRHIVHLLLLGAAASAQAAVQGQLGVSSTAELDIAVSIQPTIQIDNVSDIQLDIFDVTRDASVRQQICIRGTRGGRYSIIATGAENANGAFVLASTEGDELTFRLTFAADLASAVSDELTPGVASPPYPIQSYSVDCAGQDTSAFTLLIGKEALQQVQTGTYTGYLTFYIAPQ